MPGRKFRPVMLIPARSLCHSRHQIQDRPLQARHTIIQWCAELKGLHSRA